MCQLSGVLTGRAKIFIILVSYWLSSASTVVIIVEYVSSDSVLNHFNLVNILSAKGPKRKPRIQLGVRFCIQFVPFYLSYVGTDKSTKTLCVSVQLPMTALKVHLLNRKLITEGIFRYFCHKSTFEDKLNVCRQRGAGMQFHFINIFLHCFEKGANAFIVYVRNSGFS